MITLTEPKVVNSVLGSTDPAHAINYDRMVFSPMNFDPIGKRISGSVVLRSTASGDMQPIAGTFNLDVNTGLLQMEIRDVGFYQRRALNSGQITALQNVLNNTQRDIEQGFITVGAIAGTWSIGI
jgi:hypothetical protein